MCRGVEPKCDASPGVGRVSVSDRVVFDELETAFGCIVYMHFDPVDGEPKW